MSKSEEILNRMNELHKIESDAMNDREALLPELTTELIKEFESINIDTELVNQGWLGSLEYKIIQSKEFEEHFKPLINYLWNHNTIHTDGFLLAYDDDDFTITFFDKEKLVEFLANKHFKLKVPSFNKEIQKLRIRISELEDKEKKRKKFMKEIGLEK